MKKQTESVILEILAAGPVAKEVLLKEAQEHSGASLQAVYRALRKLMSQDVLLEKAGQVKLSLVFIESEVARVNALSNVYGALSRPYSFTTLREGESLTLRFRTLQELDLYWTESFLYLEKSIPSEYPVYSVIPHDWFNLFRPQTDALWVGKQKRVQRMVITHPLAIDKTEGKKHIASGYEILFDKNPLHQEEWEYKNILRDWIFEASLDKKVNETLVENLTSQNIDPQLPSQRGRFALKIIRSQKKASTALQKIEKYF